MAVKTVLLIGFSEQSVELLSIFDAENTNLCAYVSEPCNPVMAGLAASHGVELQSVIGPWLYKIDVIAPLMSAKNFSDHIKILQDHQRFELAMQRYKPEQVKQPLENRPCWIETISPDQASPTLQTMYQSLSAAHGKIHNLYQAFSLQPAPLISADAHYRAVLHDEANQSEPWFLELLSSQVAILAGCGYALANHGANFRKLLGDEALGHAMLDAVQRGDLDNADLFSAKQSAFLRFGEKLSINPNHMNEDDIIILRNAEASDTEILEGVQATACFAYWTRFINGLGITLGKESIGRQDI